MLASSHPLFLKATQSVASAVQFWQLDNLVGSGFKKKSIKAAVWQSVLSDFLIFQQAIVELYHFNSSILSFPQISLLFNWLPFFCPILSPVPSLTYLQRKHHRIMLSGWVIPVMKVELFLGNGSKNICMVNLYAKMLRWKGWVKPLPLLSQSLPAVVTESILVLSSIISDCARLLFSRLLVVIFILLVVFLNA